MKHETHFHFVKTVKFLGDVDSYNPLEINCVNIYECIAACSSQRHYVPFDTVQKVQRLIKIPSVQKVLLTRCST